MPDDSTPPDITRADITRADTTSPDTTPLDATSPDTTPPDTVTRLLRRRAEVGPLWIDASGSSMGQAVPDGARVLVTALSRPRRGEVWAMCSDDGRVIVHRVLGMVDGRWWLQGDANRSPDPPVELDRLIGRVDEIDAAGRHRRLGALDRLVARSKLDIAAVWKRLRAVARSLRRGPRR